MSEVLAWRPWLRVERDFVDDGERRALLELALGAAGRAGDGAADEAGFAAELPVAGEPALARLTARVEAATGLRDARPGFVRLRHYEVGQGHPEHGDHHAIDGASLVATAMLVLEAPEDGGATAFPHALPWPAAVQPRAGQLVLWRNVLSDGADDPRAAHRGEPVRRGRKTVLLWFFYLTADDWRARPAAPGEGSRPAIPAPAPGTVLTCIGDDGVPLESVELLRHACERRGVLLRLVAAGTFGYAPDDRLPPWSMLFRPAVSLASLHVEDFLCRDDVATFHAGAGEAHFACSAPLRAMERAGVNVPRTFPVASAAPGLLASLVERLGGFPVVLKVGGAEGGLGVLRADSEPALRSLVEHLTRGGAVPMMSAYIPDAVHHRVVVVGERAVATYTNPVRPGDFRSLASTDPGDYSAHVPGDLAAPAVRAVHAQRVLFGGVDLLRHPSGRVYVLEVNFPCYFPQAEGHGVDVVGPMVDFLIARARSMAAWARPQAR